MYSGARNTYNDTVGVKTDVEDIIPLLVDPFDIPLYMRFGTKPPAVQSFRHEWQEENLEASQDDMGAGDITNIATTVPATDGTKFKAGDLVQIAGTTANEKVRVVSVAGNNLTVNRGYAGTVGTAVTTVACNLAGGLKIIGQVASDGADPRAGSGLNATPKFNLHQTWQEMIEVTTQDEWQQNFGIDDKFGHEMDKLLKKLGIRRAYAMIKGARFEDPANKARLMGGLDFYITTNVGDAGGVDFDEDIANGRLRLIYRAGGRASLIAVSDTQKSKVSALISAAQRRYDRPGDSETAGVSVDAYISDFGRQDILMDRQVDADRAYFLTESLIRKVSGMPLTLENLAKTGSSRKAQVLGWDSFELKAEKQHAISTNLSTT